MYRSFLLSSAILLVSTTSACSAVTASGTAIPDPALDAPLASAEGEQTAVLAGGCFWGVEAVFEHVKGVKDVRSGYAGGSDTTASYEQVSSNHL
jgi:peptide-methionine (S)-S-oxide reductase